jgi:hypothetical protein
MCVPQLLVLLYADCVVSALHNDVNTHGVPGDIKVLDSTSHITAGNYMQLRWLLDMHLSLRYSQHMPYAFAEEAVVNTVVCELV